MMNYPHRSQCNPVIQTDGFETQNTCAVNRDPSDIALKEFYVVIPDRSTFSNSISKSSDQPTRLRVVSNIDVNLIDPQEPVLVLIHGAGMSAISWAPMMQSLTSSGNPALTLCAFELRAHGQSSGEAKDLSMQILVEDTLDCLAALSQNKGNVGVKTKMRSIFLVGHSLGGAIAIRVAQHLLTDDVVQGLVVIDMVEGMAVQALRHMGSYLRTRPKLFSSAVEAIQWFTKHGGMKNAHSAQVTVPHLLKRVDEAVDTKSASSVWTWRTKLEDTQSHWETWFSGCSEAFLSVGVPKLLLVAGTDRLDNPLTIAHMQGKFQFVVISGTGHYMMEDAPQECGEKIQSFIERVHKVNQVLRTKNSRSI